MCYLCRITTYILIYIDKRAAYLSNILICNCCKIELCISTAEQCTWCDLLICNNCVGHTNIRGKYCVNCVTRQTCHRCKVLKFQRTRFCNVCKRYGCYDCIKTRWHIVINPDEFKHLEYDRGTECCIDHTLPYYTMYSALQIVIKMLEFKRKKYKYVMFNSMCNYNELCIIGIKFIL